LKVNEKKSKTGHSAVDRERLTFRYRDKPTAGLSIDFAVEKSYLRSNVFAASPAP